MTRPDTTPGKGDTPRVSDERLAQFVRMAEEFQTDGFPLTGEMMFALDLRDARQSLAARDARIAELEREPERDNRNPSGSSYIWEQIAVAETNRADRLAAEIAELRTAGTRADGLREAAEIADRFTCGSCGMDGKCSEAIRAHLAAPAEPVHDAAEDVPKEPQP